MTRRDDKRDGKFGGYILIALGVFFLLSKFITWLTFGLLWPLILIGVGIYIISRNNEKNNENGNQTIIQKDGEKQDEK